MPTPPWSGGRLGSPAVRGTGRSGTRCATSAPTAGCPPRWAVQGGRGRCRRSSRALLRLLAHAVEDIVSTSPWLLLRRASSWSRTCERYLKALIVSNRPLTQVWPSQRTALDAGLLDARAHNLTVTMPTPAGKTHIAEWAILHAPSDTGEADESPFGLCLRYMDPSLAVYVVPTRALAAQVERHLATSLELVGLRVSSLFGGAEHVRYENQLLDYTDVLVVTTEKLDLLLRNTPELASRLRLVLVDEGHSIDRSARGLRLEMVLTRIRRTTPSARIVLLSAVLPNGEDIARWLEPTADGTNHAEIDWSPSQLRTGVFSWQGQEKDGQTGSIQYGTAQGRDFFVPKVLTRRLTRTRLSPRDAKDVAAALALHFERLGPVLISTTQPSYARAAAGALQTALRKTDNLALGMDCTDIGQRRRLSDQRLALSEKIAELLGEEHASSPRWLSRASPTTTAPSPSPSDTCWSAPTATGYCAYYAPPAPSPKA
ncbi:DEAD/DEAH box helicase [Streptomyces sp. NPDC057101]|uniref:DEAD/DEAH box helicase n=1 Tax=Streptomyces sp. NPDC057101 TaxID=3346020 RepID=UPI00364573F6